MIYTLTDELTLIWIEEVQKYFASDPASQPYRWTQDDATTKVLIVDRFPDTMRRWPAIIVSGMVGDTAEASFSQSAGPEYDTSDPPVEIGERFVGFYLPRVEFNVEAASEKDVKRVLDILLIGLVRKIRFSVENSTGGRVRMDPPVVRVSGRPQPRQIGEKLFVYSIQASIGCRVEWHDVVLYEHTVEDVVPSVTLLDC